ncbi:class I SAM-dependent methyltransferase [Brevibacterium celere]|uniref:class I SAM-dependent methyltransferase n=1 Tax=Brevibacterium celere TaxID=225845 RepID=UPI0031E2493A
MGNRGDGSGTPSLSAEQRAGAERLGAALYAAGYTEPRLRQFWGGPVSDALARNNAAPALRHCRQVLRARGADTGPGGGTDSPSSSDSPSGAGEASATEAASADLSFDERLAVLALTFLLRDTLPTALLEAALGAADCATAFDLGLLADASGPGTGDDRDRDFSTRDASASFVTAPFAVAPFDLPVGVPRGLRPGDENLYLVSDHGTLTSPDVLDGDFVLGVGGAGRTLVSLTPRDHVALAADIGTGCGIQALLLARHADRVIATDISARALHLTALGAALNGVTNLDLRQGSLLDPIDSTVDLLVSNPPFVITPRGAEADAALPAFDYRDGGMRADRLVRELFTEIPSVLAPGGRAVCLGNWEVTPDSTSGPETWVSSTADGTREPTASHDTTTATAASHDTATATPARDSRDTSTAAAETSVFVIEREILDPVTYAETWIRDGGIPRASAEWNAATSAWLDDFASRKVTEIVFGYVLMHRADNDSSSLSPQATGTTLGRTDLAEAGAVPAFRARVRITSAPATNPHGIGAFVQTIHELGAWAESAGDEEIAATAFTRSPDLVEHRHFVPGETDPTSITVEQGIGFGRVIDVDTALAGFLSVADGSLTLRQTAAALAQLLGVDEAALGNQLIAQVRGLVAAGMLLPGGD